MGLTMSRVIKEPLLNTYHQIAKWYLTPWLRRQWLRRTAARINERPVEYGFALRWLATLCPERVLDVGSGLSAWPELVADCGYCVTAIDEPSQYWRGRVAFNRHYYVIRDDITRPRLAGQFDCITCISVLEHILDHHAAMRGMFSLLKVGGHLLLTFPYHENQYVGNAYRAPGVEPPQHPDDLCQVFSHHELADWLRQNPGRIVAQEYYQIFRGPHWGIGERLRPSRHVNPTELYLLTCLLIQKEPA